MECKQYRHSSDIDQPPYGTVVLKAIQYNTKFIYIVGDTNSITLAMNSYLPTEVHTTQYRYRSAGFIFSTFSVISLE